jgi:hypothetical protein
MLTHIPRVFALKNLFVHVCSLLFQGDDVRVVSFFIYSFQNLTEI